MHYRDAGLLLNSEGHRETLPYRPARRSHPPFFPALRKSRHPERSIPVERQTKQSIRDGESEHPVRLRCWSRRGSLGPLESVENEWMLWMSSSEVPRQIGRENSSPYQVICRQTTSPFPGMLLGDSERDRGEMCNLRENTGSAGRWSRNYVVVSVGIGSPGGHNSSVQGDIA